MGLAGHCSPIALLALALTVLCLGYSAGDSLAAALREKSSERPSPEPILEKETSPAVLGGREFWKRSGSLKCLEL